MPSDQQGEEMKPVLVTTNYRGVFFGTVNDAGSKNLPKEITLANARNCIYWASGIGGFLGLASKGPSKECRIGSKVGKITLYDITSVTPVTDSAAKVWDEAKTYGE